MGKLLCTGSDEQTGGHMSGMTGAKYEGIDNISKAHPQLLFLGYVYSRAIILESDYVTG